MYNRVRSVATGILGTVVKEENNLVYIRWDGEKHTILESKNDFKRYIKTNEYEVMYK